MGGAEVQGKWAQESLTVVALDPVQGTSLTLEAKGVGFGHMFFCFSVLLHNWGCYVFPILTFKSSQSQLPECICHNKGATVPCNKRLHNLPSLPNFPIFLLFEDTL